MDLIISIADVTHLHHAETICQAYAVSAHVRGTGIAQRSEEYVVAKMTAGDAVIAQQAGELVGFCYIESFENKKYVSNSGLIVLPKFRGQGIARMIKKQVFDLARNKYPDAQVFGITTSLAVMRINSALGYQPVTFSELTSDETFWRGCASCSNYEILKSKEYQMCLCTGMLAPSKIESMKHDLSAMIINNEEDEKQ